VGTNIWPEVYDSKHLATTQLKARSRGFIWFFSFLAWYSQLKSSKQPLILLLDEPGLSLHGNAQGDLLRYFEEEIKGVHQLIYSTHSPFMVDPQHFDRVRIVEDKSIDADETLPPEEQGTKVYTDVLEVAGDSLFPLQGALGYEIHQTLFVGPNSLIVEGVSDLLYIETVSGLLQEQGREELSSKWTITPVGGSDKVPTFVALLGAQKKMTIATLIDIQKKDQQTIENLYKKKLLKRNYVLTFSEFTHTYESDMEDMFEPEFYITLVNGEFSSRLKKSIAVTDLDGNIPRILVRLGKYFEVNPLSEKTTFNHYRPARYFAEHISTLKKDISVGTLDRFETAFKALNALL
jgi:predicted ATP-dependent endonuclease of OLD family